MTIDHIPMGFKRNAPDSTYRFAHFIGNITQLVSPRPELKVTDLPLYVGTHAPGLHPVTGIFLARLGGIPSLVIDSTLEEDSANESITV